MEDLSVFSSVKWGNNPCLGSREAREKQDRKGLKKKTNLKRGCLCNPFCSSNAVTIYEAPTACCTKGLFSCLHNSFNLSTLL